MDAWVDAVSGARLSPGGVPCPPAGAAAPRRTDGRRSTSGRVRVLVVDDDVSFLAAAARALAAGNPPFDVATVESGAAAIALLERSADGDGPLPDFVLLDFHLPDTTAPSVLGQLSLHPTLKGLPVLVLTRDARDEARTDALVAGARDFAHKPSRVHALRELAIRFWQRHGPDADDPPR
ncbi:MAG TPA: response regulator [Candidatus Binatia bacterium]|nr:response regulator [Candidatus Binatia bacterium]